MGKKREKRNKSSEEKTSFEQDSDPSKNQTRKTGNPSSIISWIVFAITISLVFITITSAVFPALIISTTSPFKENTEIYTPVEAFEPGVLAAPILLVNLTLLGIGIVYYKKKSTFLNKILEFEISKKIAFISMLVLLIIYISATVTDNIEVQSVIIHLRYPDAFE